MMNERVFITKNSHPHWGKSGKIVGSFKTVLGETMIEIELDDGLRAGACAGEFRIERRLSGAMRNE